jgi:hypothetical protein
VLLKRSDCCQTIFQSPEGGALGQQHQQAVETFQQGSMVLGIDFKELETQLNKDGRFEQLDQLI